MSKIRSIEYCVLTQDVTNPEPDRRSKQLINQEVFRKGMRFEKLGREYDFEQVVYEYRVFKGGLPFSVQQVTALLPFLEPAPKTVGQILERTNVSAESLIAYLVNEGQISTAEIEGYCSDLEMMGDDLLEPMLKTNWL